jgi:CDP-diacylglycerol--glycerol-3-phosphate 3-phosphatidyltransferase
MVSEHIGHFFSVCRDAVARTLLRIGLRPNHITVLGMLFTVAAGVAVACGRVYWRPTAIGFLIGAGACDILDGAMAILGKRITRFGAILDSVSDRVGDAALFLGAAFYYALHPDTPGEPANLTLAVLAALGLVWAFLTSYLRARAGEAGAEAHGGFWQRGERVVTLLLGIGFLHLATAVWILGIFPIATVAHRLWRARRTCPQADGKAGEPPGEDEPRGLLGVLLFRWRRGTIPFDLQAGTTVALLVFLDVPPIDPLRRLVEWLVGA